VVDPKPEPPVVVDPEPPVIIIDPTEIIVDPIIEETCPEQRANFALSKQGVVPEFTNTKKCNFALKQCNSKRCFCVDKKTGKKKLEVPLSADYD